MPRLAAAFKLPLVVVVVVIVVVKMVSPSRVTSRKPRSAC